MLLYTTGCLGLMSWFVCSSVVAVVVVGEAIAVLVDVVAFLAVCHSMSGIGFCHEGKCDKSIHSRKINYIQSRLFEPKPWFSDSSLFVLILTDMRNVQGFPWFQRKIFFEIPKIVDFHAENRQFSTIFAISGIFFVSILMPVYVAKALMLAKVTRWGRKIINFQ